MTEKERRIISNDFDKLLDIYDFDTAIEIIMEDYPILEEICPTELHYILQ